MAVQDNEIKGVLEMLLRKTAEIADAEAVKAYNMPAEITMAEQNNEIKGVLEMLVRKTTERAEADGDMKM